jgi:hypothetical protein
LKLSLSTRIGSIIVLALGSAAAQPVAPAAPPAAPAAQPVPAPAPAPAPAPPPAAAAPAPVVIQPAPAPAPEVLAPGPEVVVPPAPELPPEPPKAPKALEIGSGGGDWKPGGLLQIWLFGSHQDTTPAGATAPVADEDTLTFRIRRAEIRVKGDIVPKRVAFSVMIDPARALEVSNRSVPVTGGGGGSVTVAQPPAGGALTILQDVAITFPTDYVDVSIGQFKIPLSYEGYNSSSKILFPERAPVARNLGDRRDIGLKFEKKIGEYFGYYAGIFNGSGQNQLDADTEKDAALRLEVYPFEGATIAGVGYATVGKRKKSSRDRVEADLRYEANNLHFTAEYIHAWTTTRNGPAVEAHGIYAQAAYTFFDHFQPMLRVGSYEANMDVPDDHFRHYEAGLNWLFQKNEAKLGLAVAVFAPTDEKPPTNTKRVEGILAAQAAF